MEGYDLPVFHYFAVIEMQYVLVFSASPDTTLLWHGLKSVAPIPSIFSSGIGPSLSEF